MGIDHYFYLFIGRKCTDDEAKELYKKLLDLNEIDTENMGFDDYGDDMYWRIDGLHVVCLGPFEDLETKRDKLCFDDFEWYVCQQYIDCRSHRRMYNEKPLKWSEWKKPYDERYGLMTAYNVSY